MEATSHKKILLVDDEEFYRNLHAELIELMGFSVCPAANAQEALRKVTAEKFDLVITDNCMPGMSGAEMAAVLKQKFPELPIFMYSGHIPPDRSTLDAVLARPGSVTELSNIINRLLYPHPAAPTGR